MEARVQSERRAAAAQAADLHSEADLLAAARAGSREAAEVLVDRSYELVYRSLLKLSGDPDTAADLTQDAYARAWAALGSFQGRARFSTWMYRIAYTTFLNHVRRPQPFQNVEPELIEGLEDPTVADPASRIDGRRLRRAVLALPEDLRFAVSARFWGGLPVREIARHEGVTTVAIRKRLRRAFRELGRQLDLEEPT